MGFPTFEIDLWLAACVTMCACQLERQR